MEEDRSCKGEDLEGCTGLQSSKHKKPGAAALGFSAPGLAETCPTRAVSPSRPPDVWHPYPPAALAISGARALGHVQVSGDLDVSTCASKSLCSATSQVSVKSTETALPARR